MANTQAIKNTLKMMGVSSKDTMLFGDAFDCLEKVIGKSSKEYYQNVMFNTVIMGKTVKDWTIQFQNEVIKNKLTGTFLDTFSGEKITRPIKKEDLLEFEDYHCGCFERVLNDILQEYYKVAEIFN